MFLNFGCNTDIRHCLLGLIYFTALLSYVAALEEHDACIMHDGSSGICVTFSKCESWNKLRLDTIVLCDCKRRQIIICCSRLQQTLSVVVLPQQITSRRKPIRVRQRPAYEACRNLKKDLSPVLMPHILGGPVVFPGEYPFMAALGYSENKRAPYEFQCGGTLIHDRFVLTSATCVKRVQPSIVRLGVVNFNDPDEQIHRMDVTIQKIHIHPKHSHRGNINDVALLEFENPVKRTRYITPTCLYTDNVDPSSDAKLFVAGWGVFNYTTREISSKLSKTKMNLVLATSCNATYNTQGYTIQPEHLCAIDSEYTGKPCLGDAGGPLILIVDESLLEFEQVGIISSGIGCSNDFPSVYMRVSDYLDYIENIVWPLN